MELKVSIRNIAALAQFTGKWPKVRAAIVLAMERLSIIVQRGVKEDKLTGQVLHVRTGTLRRSINRRVDDQGGAIMASVGTNVVYARPHEFGFHGSVDVREHVRKSGVRVRAHSRVMNVREASFLRSEVRDREAQIRTTLRDEAMRALRS